MDTGPPDLFPILKVLLIVTTAVLAPPTSPLPKEVTAAPTKLKCVNPAPTKELKLLDETPIAPPPSIE